MNNEISNKPCGCGNCEPMCTTCGRPWVVCKGECGCKKPCCNKVNFCEYSRAVPGCIRERAPECPMQAVIPSVVVEDVTGLKNLADCFVHVTNINTTFYVDDKHRASITWAGPVEYDDYDLDANTLGLRSQFLIDHTNNYAAYYNKTGGYQKFNFSEDGDPLRFTVNFSTDGGDWGSTGYDSVPIGTDNNKRVATYEVEGPITFTNEATSEVIELPALVTLLQNGQKVILNNVPLGLIFDTVRGFDFENMTVVDNVEIESKVKQDVDGVHVDIYSGSAGVLSAAGQIATPLSVFISSSDQGGVGFAVQGFYTEMFS